MNQRYLFFLLIAFISHLSCMNPDTGLIQLQKQLDARKIPLNIIDNDINSVQTIAVHKINGLVMIEMNPLEYLIQENHNDLIESLIACGADVNCTTKLGTPLRRAVHKNNENAAHILTQYGARINPEESSTLLVIASACGNLDLIQLFLSLGIDINAVDEHGNTALMHAIMNNQLKATQLLFSRGATLKSDPKLQQALTLCKLVAQGSREVIMLIQEKIQEQKELVQACDKLGKPPIAIKKSHIAKK